jgi:hypothetical protein
VVSGSVLAEDKVAGAAERAVSVAEEACSPRVVGWAPRHGTVGGDPRGESGPCGPAVVQSTASSVMPSAAALSCVA